MSHNDCNEAYITTIQREKIPSRSSGQRTECHSIKHGRINRRSNHKLNHDSESDESKSCTRKRDHFYPQRKKTLDSDKRNEICYRATIEQETVSSGYRSKKARNSKEDQFPKSRQIKRTIPSCKESTSSLSFHTTRPYITINDEYNGYLCRCDVSFSDDYDTNSSSSESTTSSTLFSPIGQRINTYATTGKYESAECCRICEICDSNLCIPTEEERIFPPSYEQRGYVSEPSFYEEPFTSSRIGLDIETVPKRCALTDIEPVVWDSDYQSDRSFISPPMLSCYCSEDLQSRKSRQRIQNSSPLKCYDRESKNFGTHPDILHTWSTVRRSNLPEKESGDVRTVDIFNSGICFSRSSEGTSISRLGNPHLTVSNQSEPRTGCQDSLSSNIDAKYRKDGTRYPIISIQQDLKLSLKKNHEYDGLNNVNAGHVTEDQLKENDRRPDMEIRIGIGNDRRPCIEYTCNPRDIHLELSQTPRLLPKSDLSHGGSSMNVTSKTSLAYKHNPLTTEVPKSDSTFMDVKPDADKVVPPWQIPKNIVLPHNESLSAKKVTDEQKFIRKEGISPKTVTIKSEPDSYPGDSAKKETLLTLTELTKSETNINVARDTSIKPEFQSSKSSTASRSPEQLHIKVPVYIEGEKRVAFSDSAKSTETSGTSVPDLYTHVPEKPKNDSLPNLQALISQINDFVGGRKSQRSSTSSDLEYVAQLKTQMENMKNTMKDWRSCAIPLETHQSKTLEDGGGKRITDGPGGGSSSILLEVDNELKRLEDNFLQLEQKCLRLGLPLMTASKESKMEIRHGKRSESGSTVQKNTFLHEFNERVQKLLNMTTIFHSRFPDEKIVKENDPESSKSMNNAAKKSTTIKGPCSVCGEKQCLCETKQRGKLSNADQIVKTIGSERSDSIKESVPVGPSLQVCRPNECPCGTIDKQKPAKDVKQSSSLKPARELSKVNVCPCNRMQKENDPFASENVLQITYSEISDNKTKSIKETEVYEGKKCPCRTVQEKVKDLSNKKLQRLSDSEPPENSIKFVKGGTPTKIACHCCGADECLCEKTRGKFTDSGTPGSVTKSVKENYSLKTACQFCGAKHCLCTETQPSADKILGIPYEETTPDVDTNDEKHMVLSSVIKDIRDKLVIVEDDLLSCKTNISHLLRKVDHSSKGTVEDVENLQRSMIATMKDLVDSVHSLRSVGIMGQIYCGVQKSVADGDFVIGGSRMEAIEVKEEEDEFKDAKETFETPSPSRAISRQGDGAVKKSTTGTEEKCDVTQCDCIEKEVQISIAKQLTKENPCKSCGNIDCKCAGPIMKIISKICNLLIDYKPVAYVSPNSEPVSPEVHPQCVCGKSTPDSTSHEVPSGDRKSLPEIKFEVPTDRGKSGIQSETKSLDETSTGVCKGCGLPQCECKRCLTYERIAVAPEGDTKIKHASEKSTSILKSSVAPSQGCGMAHCVCGKSSSLIQITEWESPIKSASPSETKSHEAKSTGKSKSYDLPQDKNASERESKIKDFSEKTVCKGCGLPHCVCKRCLADRLTAAVPAGGRKISSVSEKGTGILKSSVALSQGSGMAHSVYGQSPSQIQDMLATEGDESEKPSEAKSRESKSSARCKGCGQSKCVCKKCLTNKMSHVTSEGDQKVRSASEKSTVILKSPVAPSQGCGLPHCVCGKSTSQINEFAPSGEGSRIIKIQPSEVKSLRTCKGCGKPKCVCKKCLTDKTSIVVTEGDKEITTVKSPVLPSQGCGMAQCECGKSPSQINEVAPSGEGSRIIKIQPSEVKSLTTCKGCGKPKCVCKKCLTDKTSIVVTEGDKEITTVKSSVLPSQGCGMAQCECGKSPSQINEVAPSGEGSRIIKIQPSEVKSLTTCKGCGKPKCVCKRCLTDKTSVVVTEGDNEITVKSSVLPSQGCGMAQCECGKSPSQINEVAPSGEGSRIIKIQPSEVKSLTTCKGCGKPKCVCKKCLTDKTSVVVTEGDNEITVKSSVLPSQGCGMAQCECGKSPSQINEVEPSGDNRIISAHPSEVKPTADCKGCGKPKCVCKESLTNKKSVVALEGDNTITSKKSSVAPSQGCGMAQCTCGRTISEIKPQESSQGDREFKFISESSPDETKSAATPSQRCGLAQCVCGKCEVAPLEADSPVKRAHPSEMKPRTVCKKCGKRKSARKKSAIDKKAVVALEGDNTITSKKSSVAPSQGCGMAQCSCGRTMSEIKPQESSQGDREFKLISESSPDETESGATQPQGCGMDQCVCGKGEVAPLEGDSPIKSVQLYEVKSPAACKRCGKSKCVCKKRLTDKKSVVASEGDDTITSKKSSVAPSQGCGMAQCTCGRTMSEIKPQESSQGDREFKLISESRPDETESAATRPQGCGMDQCVCGKGEVAPLEGESPIKSVHLHEIKSPAACKGCGKSKCVCKKRLTDKKSVVASEGDNTVTSKKSSVAPSQGCGMAQCACGRTMSEIKPQESSQGDTEFKLISKSSPDETESSATPPQGCGMIQCVCGKGELAPLEGDSPIKSVQLYEVKSPAACKRCGKSKCVCKKRLTDKKSVVASEGDDTSKKSSVAPSQGCGMAQCTCGRTMSEIKPQESSQGDREFKLISESSPDETESGATQPQGCGMVQCVCGKGELARVEGDSPIKSAHPFEIKSPAACEGCGKSKCVCEKRLTDKKSVVASEGDDTITSKKSSVAPSQGCGVAQCTCGRTMSEIKPQESSQGDREFKLISESSPDETESTAAPPQGCGMAQCMCGKSPSKMNVGVPTEGVSLIKLVPPSDSKSPAALKDSGKSESVCKQCLTDKKSVLESEVDNKITTKASSILPSQGCGMSQCTCGRNMSGTESGPDEIKSYVATSQGCAMPQCACGRSQTAIKSQIPSVGDGQQKSSAENSTDETNSQVTPSEECGTSQCVCGKSQTEGCDLSQCICKVCVTKGRSMSYSGKDDQIRSVLGNVPDDIKTFVTSSEGCGMPGCTCGRSSSREEIMSPIESLNECRMAQCACGKAQFQSQGDKESKSSTKKSRDGITYREASVTKGRSMSSSGEDDQSTSVPGNVPDNIKSFVTSSEGCGMPGCTCGRGISREEIKSPIESLNECRMAQCACGKAQVISERDKESKTSTEKSREGIISREASSQGCVTKERSMSSSGEDDQITSVPGNVPGNIKSFVTSSEGCGMPGCTCGRNGSREGIKSPIESLNECKMTQCACGKSQAISGGDKESKSSTKKSREEIISREASSQGCGWSDCACGQSLNNMNYVPASEGDSQIKSMPEGCRKSRCMCGGTRRGKSAFVNKKERVRDETPHSKYENKDSSLHPCGLLESESENCLHDSKYFVTEEKDTEFKDAQTCSENEEEEYIQSQQCGRLRCVCGKPSSRSCGKSHCTCKEIQARIKGSSKEHGQPECVCEKFVTHITSLTPSEGNHHDSSGSDSSSDKRKSSKESSQGKAKSLDGRSEPGCICVKGRTDVKSALPTGRDGHLNNVYCGKYQCPWGKIIPGIKGSHVTSPERCSKAQCTCGHYLTGPSDEDSEIRDKQENMKSTTTACQYCGLTQCICGNGLSETSKTPSERAHQIKRSSEKCKNCGQVPCVCEKTAKNSRVPLGKSPIKSDPKKRTDKMQNVPTSSRGYGLLQCGCEKSRTQIDCRSDNAKGGCNKAKCVCGKSILNNSGKRKSEDSNNSSATNSGKRSSKKNTKGKSKKRGSKRRGSETKEGPEKLSEESGTTNCTYNDTAIAGPATTFNVLPVRGWDTNPFIVGNSAIYSLASSQPETDIPNSVLETFQQCLCPTQENQAQVSGTKAVTNYQYATVLHRTNPFYLDYGQPNLMESAGGIVTNDETVTDVKKFVKHLHNQYAAVSSEFGSDPAVSNLLSSPFTEINQQAHPQVSLPANEFKKSSQGQGAETVQPQADLLNQTISSQQPDGQNSTVVLTDIVNHLNVLVQEMSKNKDEITQLSNKMSEQLKNEQSTSSKRLTGSSLILKSSIHRAKEANALEYQELQRIERDMTSAIETLTRNVDGMNSVKSLAESEIELRNVEMRLQQAEEELAVSLASDDSDEYDNVD